MTRRKINGRGFTTQEDRIIWEECERGVDTTTISRIRMRLERRGEGEIKDRILLLRGMEQFNPTQYHIPARYRPTPLGALPAHLLYVEERKGGK